jgi:ATP-dependent helicase HrpA
LQPLFPLTEARFLQHLEAVHRELPMLVSKVRDLFEKIREGRAAILASPKRYAGLEHDLQRLAPDDFLATTPYERLIHIPRYLKAVQVRAERAAINPAKDAEKARPLAPFLRAAPPAKNRDAFRWLLEEFRVSLFAQELGTAEPVSIRRLESLLEGS